MLVFERFIDDFKRSDVGQSNPDDPIINVMENNVMKLRQSFGQVSHFLSDYDGKLVKVLEQHEEDFIYAYKMHMVKIEKEL